MLQVRHIADILARSNLVIDLANAARAIARVCQSEHSRQYKVELRNQGVLEQLIVLADELDSTESQTREHAVLLNEVFRLYSIFCASFQHFLNSWLHNACRGVTNARALAETIYDSRTNADLAARYEFFCYGTKNDVVLNKMISRQGLLRVTSRGRLPLIPTYSVFMAHAVSGLTVASQGCVGDELTISRRVPHHSYLLQTRTCYIACHLHAKPQYPSCACSGMALPATRGDCILVSRQLTRPPAG